MKRLFIWLSTLLLSVFLVVHFFNQKELFLFAAYDSVDLVGSKVDQPMARENLTEGLEQFARENKSLIGRRIVEPNASGKTRFTYALYGQERPPKGIKVASKESQEASDLRNSYLILAGDVTKDQLVQKMADLGFDAVAFQSLSPFYALLSLLGHPMVLMSVLLLLLTFSALTGIEQIKTLKTDGIRYLSGSSLTKIVTRTLASDLKLLGFAFFGSGLLGSLLLFALVAQEVNLVFFYLLSIASYLFSLLLIRAGLTSLLVSSLRGFGLANTLKVKLPLKSIMTVMLLGQFLAVLAVGWATNQLYQSYQDIQVKEAVAKEWDSRPNLYHLRFGYALGLAKEDESQALDKSLWQFAQEMVAKDQALLIHAEGLATSPFANEADLQEQALDYPVLYVSPNYLTRKNLGLDQGVISQLNQLEEGQFGLLIPKAKQGSKAQIEEQLEQKMAGYSSIDFYPDHEHLFEVSARTHIISDVTRHFLYSVKEPLTQPYLENPIIIVTSPSPWEIPHQAMPFGVLLWLIVCILVVMMLRLSG